MAVQQCSKLTDLKLFFWACRTLFHTTVWWFSLKQRAHTAKWQKTYLRVWMWITQQWNWMKIQTEGSSKTFWNRWLVAGQWVNPLTHNKEQLGLHTSFLGYIHSKSLIVLTQLNLGYKLLNEILQEGSRTPLAILQSWSFPYCTEITEVSNPIFHFCI